MKAGKYDVGSDDLTFKVTDEKIEEAKYLCKYFKLCLIGKLKSADVVYTPTLQKQCGDSSQNIKYFAFRMQNYTEQCFLEQLEYVSKILDNHIKELGLKSYYFNFQRFEPLIDADDFSALVRGLFIVEPKEVESND